MTGRVLHKPYRNHDGLSPKMQHLGATAPVHNALICRHWPKKNGPVHSNAAALAHRINSMHLLCGGKPETDALHRTLFLPQKTKMRAQQAERASGLSSQGGATV
jgi:hypothetical protein